MSRCSAASYRGGAPLHSDSVGSLFVGGCHGLSWTAGSGDKQCGRFGAPSALVDERQRGALSQSPVLTRCRYAPELPTDPYSTAPPGCTVSRAPPSWNSRRRSRPRPPPPQQHTHNRQKNTSPGNDRITAHLGLPHTDDLRHSVPHTRQTGEATKTQDNSHHTLAAA